MRWGRHLKAALARGENLQRGGKRYSRLEIERLKEMFVKGVHVTVAAKIVGRTKWGLAEMARNHFASNKWHYEAVGYVPKPRPKRQALCMKPKRVTKPYKIDRSEFDDLAFVKVVDTHKGCGREVRNVSFYGSLLDVEPAGSFMGCDPISRVVETRRAIGGGVLTRWSTECVERGIVV
jgi:hypothetical protein